MSHSEFVKEYRLSWFERIWVRLFVILNWSFVYVPIFAVSPIASRAQRASNLLLSKQLRDLIQAVASHDTPDAVIVRGAVRVPALTRRRERIKLISSCRQGYWHKSKHRRWVVRAQKQVIAILSSMGQYPLVHCYHPFPSYIFHAKAVEDTRDNQTGYPHKLPAAPSTVMPYLPFGPSLFGETRAEFEGPFSPDIAVFIMLERQPLSFGKHLKLGPRIFTYNQVENILAQNPFVLGGLRQESFSIRPDSLMGICPDSERSQEGRGDWGNKFGTVNGINLFGMRSNGAKYMRFNLDEGRTRSSRTAAGEQEDASHIARLNLALSELREKLDAPRTDLERGDILIVNNKRAALQWDDEYEYQPPYSVNNAANHDRKVQPGDRLVFQMNFYQPTELPPPLS